MTNRTYNPGDTHDRLDLAVNLAGRLTDAGFERDKRLERGPANLCEHVYTRMVRDNIVVAVYTSVSGHKGFMTARAKGNDAIRVTTVYMAKDGKQRGLSKQRRVFRTGKIDDIIERTVERARDAWKVGANPCSCRSCGAPKFRSKKGNLVCAEFCWTL